MIVDVGAVLGLGFSGLWERAMRATAAQGEGMAV